MTKKLIGKWAFLIGLIIVVIAGFWTDYEAIVALVLFALGLVIGFLNISEKDSTKFLIAVIALLVGAIASIAALQLLATELVTYIGAILTNLVAFVSAAALVVAIKAIFESNKK